MATDLEIIDRLSETIGIEILPVVAINIYGSSGANRQAKYELDDHNHVVESDRPLL